MTFVTAVRPVPLNMGHVVASLREVLTHLSDHPGCTRAELVEGLRPGTPVDSDAGRSVLSPLSWLVEKGHIIEFFNGCLSVPLREAPEAEHKPHFTHRPARGRRPDRGRAPAKRTPPPVSAASPGSEAAPASVP
jgi:hypothetical protein